MTKKHFIALADTLRAIMPDANPEDETEQGEDRQFRRTIAALADFCQSQTPRFDRARWLAYIAGECGPNGGRTCKG